MRILSILACAIVFVGCGSSRLSQSTEKVSQENIKESVYYLASDELEGRSTSTEGNRLAAKYLSDKLKDYGVKPFFSSYNDTLATIDDSWNVVGVIEGTDAELAKEYVVLGAHYDHIGLAKEGEDKVANGANDNASGTAILLELSRHIALAKENKRSVIIAFFTAEEIGLVGAKHLANRMKDEQVNVVSMLNFEMLGLKMNRDYAAYLTGFDHSTLAGKINEYAKSSLVGRLEKAVEYNLFKRSDNYPFYEVFSIPAQTFSSFDFENYEYYHHVKDEADQMDYEFMTDFTTRVLPVVKKVVNAPEGEIRMN